MYRAETWRGIEESVQGGSWSASLVDPIEDATLEVRNLPSKAEAAAAWDLLHVWELKQKGKQPSEGWYNLSTGRYSSVFPSLLGLKSGREVEERIQELADSGELGELARGVEEQRAEEGKAGQALSPGSRKRRGAEREGEVAWGQQDEGEGEEGLVGSEGNHQEGGGAGRAKKARSRLKNKPPGKPSYAGITWQNAWTAQVHFLRTHLDKEHANAMEAGRERESITLGGFASDAVAAAAADLGLLFRAHISGGSVKAKHWNYDTHIFKPLEEELAAAGSIKAVKELLKSWRDNGTIERIVRGHNPRPLSPPTSPRRRTAQRGASEAAVRGRGRGRPRKRAADESEGEDAGGYSSGEGAGGEGPEGLGAGQGDSEGEEEYEGAEEEEGVSDGGEEGYEAAPPSEPQLAAGGRGVEGRGPAAAGGSPRVRLKAPAAQQAPALEQEQAVSPRSPEEAPAQPFSPGHAAALGSGGPGSGSPPRTTKFKVKASKQPGSSRAPRSSGQKSERKAGAGGYSFILELGTTWGCQVGMASAHVAEKFKGAVTAPTGKYNVRVAGFSRAEAAAAGDLALIYRTHIYGEDVEQQQYNFPYALYTQHPSLLEKVFACRTAEELKRLVSGLRSSPLIAQLAEEGERMLGRPHSPQQQQRQVEEREERDGAGGHDRGAVAAAEEEVYEGGGTPSDGSLSEERDEGEELSGERGGRRGRGRGGRRGKGGRPRSGGGRGGGATPGSLPREPKQHGSEVVGQGIRVYWALDDEWYPGIIMSYDPETRKHFVRYDDGEEQDLNLREERYKLGKRRTMMMQQILAQQQEPGGQRVLRHSTRGEEYDIHSTGRHKRARLVAEAGAGGPASPLASPSTAAGGTRRGAASLQHQPESAGEGGEHRAPARAVSSPGGEGGGGGHRVPLRELRMLQQSQQGGWGRGGEAVRGQLSGGNTRQRGAAAGPGAAGTAPPAGRDTRLPREEFEYMYAELKYILLRTPGLTENAATCFLSRYSQLHEAWRVQFREIKDFYDAKRDDLIRDWVWCALEL